jgi:hypothetical protein
MQGDSPPIDLAVDLADVPLALLAEMAAAAEVYSTCRRSLTAAGRTIAEEVAGDDLETLTHYPRGDVYDPNTHSQYYFHLHRADDHGHFHTFLRARGMPAGVIPAIPPSGSPKQGEREPLSHLVAIGLDHRGEPGQLFTTNRWVTAETWYKADDVIAMLRCFRVGHGDPTPTANRWVGAVMTLFRPQIVKLLMARDACVARHRIAGTEASVFDDRDLEITSSLAVDIDGHIARIKNALAAR